jgi:Fe2+ or Zn2+ uptake regulation protein
MLPDADYSTIFRNVEQLLADKQIKKVVVDQKSTFYELTTEGHDHFICTDCGTVESIHVSLTDSSLKNKQVSDITVRGVCDSCEK